MTRKIGLNPGKVREVQGSMQGQVNAIASIADNLLATSTAAGNPHAYGIEAGEMTVAPWSIGSIGSARTNLVNAHSAANSMLQLILSEAGAQEEASGNNGFDVAIGAHGVNQTVRGWRSLLTTPRALLELPAAARMAFGPNGRALWAAGMNPRNWGITPHLKGSSALKTYTRTTKTPGIIRSMYSGASNLKFQNYVDPDYIHTARNHRFSSVAQWADRFHSVNPKVVTGFKVAAAGISKGFGVLGAAAGAVTFAQGLDGVVNGKATDEDKWAIADGAIGFVTGVGSLAPPPVGLVFAGVGAAWTAGRWLFGADANGKTGIDKTADFVNGAAKVIGDGAKAVSNFVEDIWPPW